MHIKEITIQGFKSYKDQTVTEPFSPHHNVVVGRNGSGKSNFFAAIRFVLNDSYSRMSQEERQSLLHESSGIATLSAYVEIVFDNSDNRFPTGRNEVVLRRTIGIKKDEYSLDKKSVTKSEVVNLLTSAGFSKSNPYYIVPQGRVNWLTNAKDSERLELLKEVAGTSLYEEHRRESLKLIEEGALKKDKISEMLGFIEERIQELEEEKQHLQEFIKLDKEKRICEFIVCQRDLDKTRNELSRLDQNYQQENNSYENEQESRERISEDLQKSKDIESSKQIQLASLEEQLRSLDEEKTELLKEKTKFEFIQQHRTSVTVEQSEANDEILKLKEKIDSKEAQLRKIIPSYNEKIETENSLREKLAVLEVQRDTMMDSKRKFKTESERNTWLNEEINAISSNIEQEEKEKHRLQEKVIDLDGQLMNLSGEIDDCKLHYQSLVDEDKSLSTDFIQQRNLLNEKRRELWKKENQVQSEISLKNNEIMKIEKNLALSGCNLSSILAVDQIVVELGLESSYFGPIYRLITLDPLYYGAVDAVAANGLFHIVVDTDETAKSILSVLQSRKLGRVTFIPLNRINPKHVTYPTNKNEGIPLLSIIQFESSIEKAIREVFSKYFICPTLEIAAKIAKSNNLNTVTLDGDKVDKRGALSGGYMKSNENCGRLENLLLCHQLHLQVKEKEQKQIQYSQQIQSLDLQINLLVSKIFQQEKDRKKIFNGLDEIKLKINGKEKEKHALESEHDSKTKLIQDYAISIKILKEKLQSMKNELSLPFVKSSFDEALFMEIHNEITVLNKNLIKIMKEKNNLECMKNAISDELENHLKKRLFQFEQGRVEFDNEDVIVFDQCKLDLIESQCKSLLLSIDETKNVLKQLSSQKDSLQSNLESCMKKISLLNSNNCSYTANRTVLTQKESILSEQIKQLGILSSEILAKTKKLNDVQISSKLTQINEQLKRFTHVNKKAIEQYQSFISQRESLLGRKEELLTSAESITNFIQTLDQQKDQTIMNTFDQVSEYFSEKFSRLVPLGRGELVMIREENSEGSMELTGVQIKVTFDRNEQPLLMSQLSGGQKSVVALALIFAIQQVDPAPFYLFDEIDANLDRAYRASVAILINELSRDAQYITTTFRPELLERADKFYGVQFINRVSHIQCITKEVALDFIEKQIAK